jgi:hypothetical protein
MKKPEKAEQDAKNFIATLDIKRILDLFEMTETETMNDPAVSIKRGWYMDEIEKRYPQEFDKWLDTDDMAISTLRKLIFAQ